MNSAALSKLTGLANGGNKSSTQDGYTALKQVIERSEADLDDIIAFVDAKRILDEQYAVGLEKLQRRMEAAANTNSRLVTGSTTELDSDTASVSSSKARSDSTLNKAWDSLRTAATSISSEHTRLALLAENEILPQLYRFRESQRKATSAVKSEIKTQSKEYNDLRFTHVAKLKKNYDTKSEELEKAVAKFAAKGEQMLENDAGFGEIPEKKWLSLGENAGSKTFRLTEELKQCDQAYRNGILALEDSRFKLQDVVEKGFRELERLESERVEVSRDACARYAKTNELLVAKSSELARAATRTVEAIRPDADITAYSSDIRNAWQGPDSVSYEKYGFGKLKDMTFGLELEKHLQGKGRVIPLVVEKCVKTLERRGLDREGLYRVPALASAVTNLRTRHEQDESVDFDVIPEAEDVSVVAALLKLYLRELPSPLFPLSDRDRAEYSKMTDPGQRMLKLRYLARTLSKGNRATLKYVVDHLCKVSMHSHHNRMSISSLATIFGAIIFNAAPLPNTLAAADKKNMSSTEAAAAAAELFKADCVVVEDLCNWHAFVFENNPADQAGPAVIPPRKESAKGPESPGTPSTGDTNNSNSTPVVTKRSPGKPRNLAAGVGERERAPVDPLRAMMLADSKGPLAMP